MVWPPSLFVVTLVVTSLVSAAFVRVGFSHRHSPGGPAFAVMMGAVSLWALGDAVQLSATSIETYRWWAAVSFVFSVVVATAGFVFVVQYTGNGQWVTRRSIAALGVEPFVAGTLAWTNELHGLMWNYSGDLRTTPVSWVPVEHGIAFQLHLAYTYTLLALLLWLLVKFYLRSRGAYRWQTLLLLVGAAVPIVTNVVWLLVQSSVPPAIDPTPVMFLLTGMLFTAGLRSFDLLELAPVGRHTVVEELHDAVLTVNAEDRIVDANPAARRILSDGEEPLVGKSAPDTVPMYVSLVDGGGEVDDVAITVGGERRYFELRQSPLTDASREAVGRVVVLRDVTDRRRAEKRFQLLIENATDVITVLDEDASIQYVSPSVRNVLGYDPEDIQGTHSFGYVHPSDREAVTETFAELVDDPGEELRVVHRFRTVDGDFRVVESRGRNLLDDPVVEGIIVTSRDVTERRERERRLEQRNEQLEEFASVISHDLRNPLSVAHGHARLLEDEHDDDRIEKITDAHARMEELLEDLLTLAREGRAVSEPEPVGLAEAARQAWAIVDTPDATLDVEDGRDLLADDTRLRQLLENLFVNAQEHGSTASSSHASADATPDGVANGGEVSSTVSVRIGTTEDGFFVADDGPGIPAPERESVFEAGESGRHEGIGLGLTIVKRIADAHGWSASVSESNAGGARFEFTGVDWADPQ